MTTTTANVRFSYEAERLRRDIRNAEVYAPEVHEAPVRRTRVFITSHRIIVWAEGASRSHSPQKVMDEAITADAPQADRGTLQGGLTLLTAQGPVHVTRGGGCGCGSVLTALDPPVGW